MSSTSSLPHSHASATIALPDAPSDLAAQLADGGAVAWSQPLTIRTYEAGEPSAYPLYLDHRVYQGSSGRIYPVPFVESVADEGVDREWQAVHLENAYLRLVVLPELGGRIHIGYDKSTDYDFFYRNNVIKPALVGLGGPWISGGVEFNWPQHHRPATYLPVETVIETDADGSVTVWCYDHDPFARMSAQHGVRLRPESSVVELVVRLHNRTSLRQSFLWWANVAARVNDDYQSFFPQDVRYVADHARRALTAFPQADREYYGVDYPALAAVEPGADRIDFYRNIPVPTSYMIVDSQADFFGGYDHGAGAGFVHWAERRFSPGKKQWTWGDAPFGHAWDDQLTDADGPYVELMAGVYTDNQPDFSWLLPGETRAFSQYWYPIPAIGVVHQATPDAAVNVNQDAESGAVTASFAVTSPQAGATLRILHDGVAIAEETADLLPGVPAAVNAVHHGSALSVELRDSTGLLLVGWAPVQVDDEEPWVADEPPAPHEVSSVEELYLTGVHLQQNRHPTRSPLLYWEEALKRDPGESRTNVALGEHAYREGRFDDALRHASKAIERITRRNGNPQDAEAFYLAGLALRRLGENTEALQAFGKAGWDGAWAAAAGFELAQLLAHGQQNRAALRVLDTLENAAAYDARRVALRVVLLRRAGRHGEAQELAEQALTVDVLDATLRVLAGRELPVDASVLFDVATDLRRAGALTEALDLLDVVAAAPASPAGNLRPIAHYTAAVVLDDLGRAAEASDRRAHARASDLTWAFPCGLEALEVLQAALQAEPDDGFAQFLLGMLLYGGTSQGGGSRRREAHALWEAAIEGGLEHPVLLRNAGLAAYAITHDDELAWARYEQAVALAPREARLRYEQDQLAARLGHSVATRLGRVAPVEDLVLTRDDFTIEYVGLLSASGRTGDAERALEILQTRQFHPWEGGEGQAIAAWDAVHGALGLPVTDPPANLAETRAAYVAPAPVKTDGETDYFATSFPELLLFAREN